MNPTHHCSKCSGELSLVSKLYRFDNMSGHSHSHEGGPSHSHASADHGHTHEVLDGPGSFLGREMPIVEGRDWKDRAFTVGIGGYVSLLLAMT